MPVSDAHIPHMEEVSERAHQNLALLYGGDSRRPEAKLADNARSTMAFFPFLTEPLGASPRDVRLP